MLVLLLMLLLVHAMLLLALYQYYIVCMPLHLRRLSTLYHLPWTFALKRKRWRGECVYLCT